MALPVTLTEASAIAAALDRELAATEATDTLTFAQRFVPRAEHCPAYDQPSGRCLAYEARPQVCRDFQCNGEDKNTHSPESFAKMVALAQRPEPIADLRDFLPLNSEV